VKALVVVLVFGRVASANCEAEKAAEDRANKTSDNALRMRTHSAWAKCMIDSGARPSDAVEDMEEKLLSTPKGRNFAWGVTLCAYAADRAERLAEIAKEKKYARLAGFVDKVKLYKLQQAIRRIDEEVASERATMKTFAVPVKPLGCGTELVKGVLECRGDSSSEKPEICVSNEIRTVLRSVKESDSWDVDE
jgi:hypothetical protein